MTFPFKKRNDSKIFFTQRKRSVEQQLVTKKMAVIENFRSLLFYTKRF